jgi:hypothetical protein
MGNAGIIKSDHRLDSLAFIIPFLKQSFLFAFFFFLYPVRHVSGQHPVERGANNAQHLP